MAFHTFLRLGYPVAVGDLALGFPQHLAAMQYSSLAVVADTNTARHCLPVFLKKTTLESHIPVISLPAGEENKNLNTAGYLWEQMLAARLDRQSVLLILGGGVVGDLAGFCASTFKRGIRFIQVPTTLLAATDAAVGGKTGLDFNGIKNIIGTFAQPSAVFADPEFFQTLPEREWRSGMAEVIKHAFIENGSLLQKFSTLTAVGQGDWTTLLAESVAIKIHIAALDPFESGLRKLLNFGHTVGHAVESYFLQTETPLTHGEAVAIGMIAESYAAWGESARTRAIVSLISRFFGRHAIPIDAFEGLWQLAQQDKKNSGSRVMAAVPAELPYEMQLLELTRTDFTAGLHFYNAI